MSVTTSFAWKRCPVGEMADPHVRNFTSGRWGARMPAPREYPKTTKAAIAGRKFAIISVCGGFRSFGQVLVVTPRDDEYFWVWNSKGVAGIAKKDCRIVEDDLNLNVALQKTGRKLYDGPVDEASPQDI